jgi:hypothetical protein
LSFVIGPERGLAICHFPMLEASRNFSQNDKWKMENGKSSDF